MEFKEWLESSSFENWFRDSKVTRNGKPLLVYHGTAATSGFHTFKSQKSLPMGSLGHWFVEDPDVAHMVASRKGSSQSIMPVYLMINKPKIIKGGLRQLVNEVSPHGEVTHEKVKTYRGQLEKEGFDGVVLPNETADGGRSTQYVVFKPNQIKSAIGNKGTYGTSDDITENLRNKLIETDWFHGSHEDFDQWDAEKAAVTRSHRPGVDTIGLWATSKPEVARKYGPKVYKYETDCKNPYVMTGHWTKTHWFSAAFFIPEVGVKFLKPNEMKTMSNPPDMLKLFELAKRKDDLDHKEMAKYLKLEDAVYKFRRLAEHLYRETDYIKSLRDHLIKKGYDCILWKNSHIDFRDIEHDVAIFLKPELLKIKERL